MIRETRDPIADVVVIKRLMGVIGFFVFVGELNETPSFCQSSRKCSMLGKSTEAAARSVLRSSRGKE